MNEQKRVLLVDDDDIIRDVCGVMVDHVGLDHLEAENGSVALELLDREACDLVLMDIDMPRMNGIELARECRTRYPDLPLFVFSSRADSLNPRDRSLFDESFTKPTNLSHMIARILQRLHLGSAGSAF